MSYNLGIAFPTPLAFSETELKRFTEQQIILARPPTGRPTPITAAHLPQHHRNPALPPPRAGDVFVS